MTWEADEPEMKAMLRDVKTWNTGNRKKLNKTCEKAAERLRAA